MYPSNLKSVGLPVPVPEIRGVAKLQTPESRGRVGHRGSGTVPFERALASSYRPSIVTFPPSLRVSEILPLLFSRTPFSLVPTPPLVSPKFPMFPWE